MKQSAIAFTSLVSLALSCSAVAGELSPLQAGTFALGNHTASVYYTVHDGLYDVVTTIAPDADLKGAPMRFVGALAPGQKQTISFGAFGTTAAPRTLELLNNGEHLVATVSDTEVAAR
jgi:hypothetical protein